MRLQNVKEPLFTRDEEAFGSFHLQLSKAPQNDSWQVLALLSLMNLFIFSPASPSQNWNPSYIFLYLVIYYLKYYPSMLKWPNKVCFPIFNDSQHAAFKILDFSLYLARCSFVNLPLHWNWLFSSSMGNLNLTFMLLFLDPSYAKPFLLILT